MANVDRPNGATVVGTLSGSPWQGAIKEYVTDATHAAIYTGDLVQMTADGYIDVFAAGETQLIGVCVGVRPASAGRTNLITDNFLSATTPTIHPGGFSALNSAGDVVQVCVAPDAIYEMQEDSDTANIAIASIGINIEIIDGGGSATTGISGMELDSDSVATTNTLPLRLLGPVDRPDNEIGTNGRWLVTPANSAWSGLNVGI